MKKNVNLHLGRREIVPVKDMFIMIPIKHDYTIDIFKTLGEYA